jgi:hypothetical protein
MMIDMTFSLKIDGIVLPDGMVDKIFKEAGGKLVSKEGHDVKYMVEEDQRATIKKKLSLLFGETQRATVTMTQAEREQLERKTFVDAKVAKSVTLEATAYHEAGHAVVGWVNGRREIKEISIIPNKHSQGRVRWLKKSEPLPNEDGHAMQ